MDSPARPSLVSPSIASTKVVSTQHGNHQSEKSPQARGRTSEARKQPAARTEETSALQRRSVSTFHYSPSARCRRTGARILRLRSRARPCLRWSGSYLALGSALEEYVLRTYLVAELMMGNGSALLSCRIALQCFRLDLG